VLTSDASSRQVPDSVRLQHQSEFYPGEPRSVLAGNEPDVCRARTCCDGTSKVGRPGMTSNESGVGNRTLAACREGSGGEPAARDNQPSVVQGLLLAHTPEPEGRGLGGFRNLSP
jgi:hypothetical protein